MAKVVDNLDVRGVLTVKGQPVGDDGGGYLGEWNPEVAYPAGSIVNHQGRTWGTTKDLSAGAEPLPPPVIDSGTTQLPYGSDRPQDAPSVPPTEDEYGAVYSQPFNAGIYTVDYEETQAGMPYGYSAWIKYKPDSSGELNLNVVCMDYDEGASEWFGLNTSIHVFEHTGTGAFSYANLVEVESATAEPALETGLLLTTVVTGGKTYYIRLAGDTSTNIIYQYIELYGPTAVVSNDWDILDSVLLHESATDPHPDYQTEQDANQRYVNITGDTITGDLTLNVPTAATGQSIRFTVNDAPAWKVERYDAFGVDKFDIGSDVDGAHMVFSSDVNDPIFVSGDLDIYGDLHMASDKRIIGPPNYPFSITAGFTGEGSEIGSLYIDFGNGGITGNMNMFDYKIVNLGNPVDVGDAANKQYVDDAIAAGGGGGAGQGVGLWHSSISYVVNDQVVWDGILWNAGQPSTGVEPSLPILNTDSSSNNDMFANAKYVVKNEGANWQHTYYNIESASTEAGEQVISGWNDTIWYVLYTTNSAGANLTISTTASTGDSILDVDMEIYTGIWGSLVPATGLGGTYNPDAVSFKSRWTGLTIPPLVIHYLRVKSYNNRIGNVVLDITGSGELSLPLPWQYVSNWSYVDLVRNKGDLIVGTGSLPVTLPVGSIDGQALVIDSGTATGLKWETVAPPEGGGGITIVQHGTDGSVVRPASPVVYWVGTATPTNALAYDFWKDT